LALSGYAKASLAILAILLGMALWVALGHGFPGGSAYRRATGHEGPTGGLTTAMRMVLHGQFAAGFGRHRAAAPVSAYLAAQLIWRAIIVVVRPRLPARTWIVDLVASLVLFAAAIWVPWLLA
jgi:uncharacterized membrane protein